MSAMRPADMPRSMFVPSSTVTGRSVDSRSVKHGIPSAEVSSLDASRVGENELRLRFEPEEVEVPERGAEDHARALDGGLQALLAEVTACPWMDREDDGMRFCERQERAHGFGQGHRIVDEGGPMQGHQGHSRPVRVRSHPTGGGREHSRRA